MATTTAPNAVITLNGISTQVAIQSDGTILDTQGKTFSLPSDVSVDSNTGNIIENGKVVGKIAPLSLTDDHSKDGTSPSSSAGAGATTAAANGKSSPASTSANGSPTLNTVPAAVGSTGGHLFGGTRNLDDGGATVPVDPPPVNPPPTDPGPGDGPGDGGGPKDPNADGKIPDTGPGGGDPETKPNTEETTPSGPQASPGDWGEGNPSHQKAPAGTYEAEKEPLTGIDKVNSIMSKVGASVGFASAILLGTKLGNFLLKAGGKASKYWGNLGKYNDLGKAIGVAGVAVAGWGIFSASLDLFRGNWKSASDWFSLGGSVVSILMIMGMTNPIGWAVIGGALLAALIYNLVAPKKDVTPDTTKAGVVGNLTNTVAPAAPGWATLLNVQSTFMILAGVTAINLGFNLSGLNLDSNGPMVDQKIIAPSLVTSFNASFTNTMQKATNTTIQNGPLGKIFIKNGEDVDKVVYVTEFTDNNTPGCNDPNKPCEAVNMVALNPGGYLVSPVAPNDSKMLQPFFAVSGKKVMPNPGAFNAVGQMNALVQVPQSGASAKGAATAINMAAMMGHTAQELPTPTPPPADGN
jgi:hypothetical protein